MVTTFKYLGRILTSRDNDWEAAYWNLKTAKQRWATISHILARESTSPQVSAFFYKAFIQMVLLYGSETWVISGEILQLLTSFHHGIACHLTGRFPRPIAESDEWLYPSIQETRHLAGLFTMDEYLCRRRGYLELYAQQLRLLIECQQSLHCKNPTRRTFWWNQPLSQTNTNNIN
jgi:hypothetical protein